MKPTTDEVLAWAFDAGFGGEYWNYAPAFKKLATLAYAAGAEQMKERAVKVCDEQGQGRIALQHYASLTYAAATHECAAAIRALGDDDE